MKQLLQKLLDGKMSVLDVATPALGKGMLLVKNHYSLISAGTEGGTVSTARKSLIGKAKERPQQVKQVVDSLKQQGPAQTYKAVMKKLDSYSPLGYSSAGEVIAVGSGTTGFSVGDLVACAGAGYANHAEVVVIPENLCVRLPNDANLAQAAYNTIGAIAMQGVRQASLKLGETCVVTGLGLIGQITCQLLRASGVNVIGIDIDPATVEIAAKHCADVAFTSNSSGLEDRVFRLTSGLGADAVIITAATSSLEPINTAGKLLRKCGQVIVVGAVPTGFNREPYFYKKELILKMSCSYGPGRYDPDYEEKGIDYPAAYVRWTEKRNMEAFQQLLHTGKLNLEYLTTHNYTLDDAPAAYDLILAKEEPFLGILIKYDVDKEHPRNIMKLDKQLTSEKKSSLGVSFIGAGSYAMGHLLPHIKNNPLVRFEGVLTSSGSSSRTVAEKFGFGFCASEESQVTEHDATDAVFITTRHDSHAGYVLNSLEQGKHVYVEKPLCLKEDEFEKITEAYGSSGHHLMVGFNRRFSPLALEMKKRVGSGVVSMLYRVNAGSIPADSWIQDMELGGGRIIGEVCHFVDFLTFIAGSEPETVYATAIDDPQNLNDTLSITLKYANGSIGSIQYFSNGPKSLPKEYIEVFNSGTTAVISDFRVLEMYGGRKTDRKKLFNQDKGQKEMMRRVIQSFAGQQESAISFSEIWSTTMVTFKILDSLKTGQAVTVR